MKLPRPLTIPRRARALAGALFQVGRRVLADPRAYSGAIAGVLGGLGSIAVALGYAHAGEVLSDPATHARVVLVLIAAGGLVSTIAGLLPNRPARPAPDEARAP